MDNKKEREQIKRERSLLLWEKKKGRVLGLKYEDRLLQITRWSARGEFSRVENVSISRVIGAIGKYDMSAISAISGRGRLPISRAHVAAGRRNLRGKSEWTCLESRAARLIQMCITEQINKYLVMSGATQICSSNVSSISAVSLFPLSLPLPGHLPSLVHAFSPCFSFSFLPSLPFYRIFLSLFLFKPPASFSLLHPSPSRPLRMSLPPSLPFPLIHSLSLSLLPSWGDVYV